MGGKLGAAAFCLLFAIPFGGVGVFASWVIGSTLADAYRAQDWVRVKATVGDATLHDGGDTFRAEGSYRYSFAGRDYAGSRLGLSKLGGADNIDDWHQEVSGRLQAARAAGKPVTVWVNPDNPAEAVFDRDIRWGEILFMTPFALAFGGVGVGALIAMVAVLRGRSPVGTGQGESGRAGARASSGNGKATPGFLWIFAFFWNAMSWPIALLALPEIVANGEWAGLLVLLFPLVGAGLLWAAVSATWTAWRERHGRDDDAPRTVTRSLPGSMTAQAARAMFDPAGRSFGPARPVQGDMPIPGSLAQVEEGAGSLAIRYSRRRVLGLAVMLFVVGSFFALGGVALFADGEAMVGALVFFAVGALVDLVAVANLVDGLTVTVRGGELAVEKTGLFGGQSWRVRRDLVTAIRPALSYTMTGTPYFSLVAEAGGQRIPLGNALKGVELADAVARKIARVLGASPSIVKPAASATGEPVTA